MMDSKVFAEAVDVLMVVDGMPREAAEAKVREGGEKLAIQIAEHLDSREAQ